MPALVLLEAEQEAALHRVGLQQRHLDAIAEAERLAGLLADQRVVLLVEQEVFPAQLRDRDQAVGAGLVEPTKRPKPVTPVTGRGTPRPPGSAMKAAT